MTKTAAQIHAEDVADQEAGLLIHQNADSEERATLLAKAALAALTDVLIINSKEPVPEGARICPGCLANLLANLMIEYCHSRDADRAAASELFKNLAEDFEFEAESIKTGMPRELVRMLKSLGDKVKVVSVDLTEEDAPEKMDANAPSSVAAALGSLFQKKA